MNASIRTELRRATQRSRKPPGSQTRLRIAFDGGGRLGEAVVSAPIELNIEATNSDRQLADWLDDLWWTELLQRWGVDPVSVHIAATPGALLHLVVLHHLDMLRRVAPKWRIVGHAYADDVRTQNDIEQLAASSYHEVRFQDAARPGVNGSIPAETALPLSRLFGEIRRAQSALGVTRPILVRLPLNTTNPVSSGSPQSMTLPPAP